MSDAYRCLLHENEVVRTEKEGGGGGNGIGGGGGVSSYFLFSRLFKVPYFSVKQVIAKKCKVVSGKQKKTLELLHNLICAYYRPDPGGVLPYITYTGLCRPTGS